MGKSKDKAAAAAGAPALPAESDREVPLSDAKKNKPAAAENHRGDDGNNAPVDPKTNGGAHPAQARDPNSPPADFAAVFNSLRSGGVADRSLGAAKVVHAVEKDRGLLPYALQRMVVGTTSSLQHAQEGFASALTLLLQRLGPAGLPTSRVLAVIRDKVDDRRSGNAVADQRHAMAGRAILYGALLRAGRLEADTSAEDVGAMLDDLMRYAHEARPLREISLEVASRIVGAVSPATLLGVARRCSAAFQPHSKISARVLNTEQLGFGIALAAACRRAKVDYTGNAGLDGLLEAGALPAMAPALFSGDSLLRFPKLHSVWGHIVPLCHDAAYLEQLWALLESEGLKPDASDKRAGVVMAVFAVMAAELPAALVVDRLVDLVLLKMMSTHLSRARSVSHALAEAAADAMAATAASDSAAGLRLVHKIRRLTAHEPRNVHYAKMVVAAVRRLGAKEAASVLDEARTLFSEAENVKTAAVVPGPNATAHEVALDEAEIHRNAVRAQQAMALDLIYALGKSATLRGDRDTLNRCTSFLFYHAFVDPEAAPASKKAKKKATKKKAEAEAEAGAEAEVYVPDPVVGQLLPAARVEVRQRLFSLLSDQLSARAASEGVLAVLAYWDALEAAGYTVRTVGGDEAAASRAAVVAAARKSGVLAAAEPHQQTQRHVASTDDDRARSLHVLLLHMLLLLLDCGADEEAEDADELVSLVSDFQKAMAEWQGGKDAELKHVVVLVEAMVALLTRPSALVRGLVNSAFSAWVDKITLPALEVLLRVVNPPAAEKDDGDRDEDDDAKDKKKAHKRGATSAEKEGDSGDDDDDDDDDDEDDDDADDKTGRDQDDSSGNGNDSDDDDDDDEEEEDIPLDDVDPEELAAEFAKYDSQVVGILKLRRQKHASVKHAAENQLHFAVRVSELLSMVGKHRPKPDLALPLLTELLAAMASEAGAARPAAGKAESSAKASPLFARLSAVFRDVLASPATFEAAVLPAESDGGDKKAKKGKKAPASKAPAEPEESPLFRVMCAALDRACSSLHFARHEVPLLSFELAAKAAAGFVRSSSPDLGSDELSAAESAVASRYAQVLRSLARKNGSASLLSKGFISLLSALPRLRWALLPVLLEIAEVAPAELGKKLSSTTFRQPLELFKVFLKHRHGDSTAPVEKFLAKFGPAVVRTLAAYAAPPASASVIKAGFVRIMSVFQFFERTVGRAKASEVFTADAVLGPIRAAGVDEVKSAAGVLKKVCGTLKFDPLVVLPGMGVAPAKVIKQMKLEAEQGKRAATAVQVAAEAQEAEEEARAAKKRAREAAREAARDGGDAGSAKKKRKSEENGNGGDDEEEEEEEEKKKEKEEGDGGSGRHKNRGDREGKKKAEKAEKKQKKREREGATKSGGDLPQGSGASEPSSKKTRVDHGKGANERRNGAAAEESSKPKKERKHNQKV